MHRRGTEGTEVVWVPIYGSLHGWYMHHIDCRSGIALVSLHTGVTMHVVNQVTQSVIGAAVEVHRALGPGLLERVYEECLCHELGLRNIAYERQRQLPVQYKGQAIDCSYRIDVLVSKLVVVEIKAVESLLPIHEAQLLTYLRLGGWQAGLLLNFNVPSLRLGIKRLVHRLGQE
jgi:GxxExxY protein